MLRLLAPIAAAFALVACAGTPPDDDDDGDAGGPFAVEVVSFTPGDGAGFGQDKLPDVVLGPPHAGASTAQGGTDVLSLGGGGTIVLQLGAPLVDGDGADLIVFENPFIVGAEGGVFGEPGEVSVSEDGDDFIAFPCDADAATGDEPAGCAGFGVVFAGDDVDVDATNPATAGGDAFDLADVGVATARFVRIVDKGAGGAAPSAGFDLDAVANVHAPR